MYVIVSDPSAHVLLARHVVSSQAVTSSFAFSMIHTTPIMVEGAGHLMPSSLSLAKSKATMKTPTVAPPFYHALQEAAAPLTRKFCSVPSVAPKGSLQH